MPISDRAVGAGVAAGALLLFAACSDPGARTADTNVLAEIESQQATAAEDDGNILCARGSAALHRVCTIEQTQDQRGLLLTLRHPDGGFHRLLVTRDGRGVIAADGAEPARVTIPDAASIDVRVGADLYRLPATIKSQR